MKVVFVALMGLVLLFGGFQLKAEEDENLWLEEVLSKKSLEWVKLQNQDSVALLEKVPGFKETNQTILDILNSDKRIPFAYKLGDYFYNFWKDAKNPRGILRRTTLTEYKKQQPLWEIILDIDALAKEEKENWVYKGMSRLYPDYHLGLLSLSRGGADATVVREFDFRTKSLVKGGFALPEGKHNVDWRDQDSIYVSTDFGPGSLSKSGYPRIVKLWKRGTPLKDAQELFKCDDQSVTVYGARMFSEDGHLDIIADIKSFFDVKWYVLSEGKLQAIDLPSHAYINSYFKKQFLITLQKDWDTGKQSFKAGSIIVVKKDDLLTGKKVFQLLAEPSERISIAAVSSTKSLVLVNMLDNVAGKLYQFTQDEKGEWHKALVPTEKNGSLSVFNTNEKSDDYFINYSGFLIPESLYMVAGKDATPELLKSSPADFNAEPFTVDQLEAVSKDGTKIPYFLVKRKDMTADGQSPTLLYGYGGFNVSMKPRCMGVKGKTWLEKGGVYVLANIRGGGEFGPQWHQAALEKNRHKAFEDFIAVAEDLIKRKITNPQKLAVQGGSNGGLLVGAVFTMRPDLFKAVHCEVPLLDMKRYHKLLAGASWTAEYGDPDKPDMWEYIKTYSPYHNLKKDVHYPQVLFTTSTRDDRVHPGHARKMVARMKAMGHNVLYYENVEGGHASAADNTQRAFISTLSYTFLYKMLMGK